MGKTLANLRAGIGNWLDVDTGRLANPVRDDIINIVMRELLRLHELRFGETSDTFATVASTRDYALPPGFSKPFNFWYTHPTSGGIVMLEYLGKDRFDFLYPDSTKEALPESYTFWGSDLQLGKTPDQILTINRNYYKILADLEDYVAATISFDDSDESINDTAGGLPILPVGGQVTVSGSTNNNGTFTVVSSTASKIVTETDRTTEAAGADITISPSNVFTRDAWEVILFKSLVKASEYGIEDARIGTWQREAEKHEAMLVIEHARARTTGRKSISQEPG